MSDDLSRLLKAVALDDERLGDVAISPRLQKEFRQRRAATVAPSRWFGYTLAVGLLAALSLPIWWHPSIRGISSRGASREVVTSFLPLAYGAVPMADGRIVRIELPRRSLAAFGLLPLDGTDTDRATVLADVLVGEDGLARAVRFVRVARPTSH